MENIQIGGLSLRWSVLVALAALAIAYIVLYIKLKDWPEHRKSFLDVLVNGGMIAAAVWKLAPFVQDPQLLIERPSSLLIVTGGTFEAVLGLTAAAVYIIYAFYKRKLPLRIIADISPYALASSYAVYSLMVREFGKPTSLPWGISLQDPAYSYHPIHIYKFAVALLLIVWLLRQGKRIGTGWVGRRFLFYAGAGLMATTLFAGGEPVLLYLTGEQIAYLIMMAVPVALGAARRG